MVAGSIVPNLTATLPLTARPWKRMDQRPNPSLMETFDPTGCRRADRHL
jgi:hypothetical protein